MKTISPETKELLVKLIAQPDNSELRDMVSYRSDVYDEDLFKHCPFIPDGIKIRRLKELPYLAFSKMELWSGWTCKNCKFISSEMKGNCYSCHNRSIGFGRGICESMPIGKVTITDRQPIKHPLFNCGVWFHELDHMADADSRIPDAVFKIMWNQVNPNIDLGDPNASKKIISIRGKFDNMESANLAAHEFLGWAALTHARRLAGMAPLYNLS